MQSFQIITPDRDRPFTIGRKSDNRLVLDNTLVSRYHGVIERDEKCWYLTNLSQNSVTRINGIDIPCHTKECAGEACRNKIDDGDEIHIGTYRIRVSVKDGQLSLLLINSPTSSSSELPKGVTAKVKQDMATLEFSHKVVNPRGKTLKRLQLKEGDSIRIPGYQLDFSAGNLSCKNTPRGFDLDVSRLDVYAGKRRLLKDMNFHLSAGEVLAIIGRSGQGKSTFLKLLQGTNRGGKNSKVRIGGLDYRNQ